MSKSVNKVILVGNLTRDPETSYHQELAIAKFAMLLMKEGKIKAQESGKIWRNFTMLPFLEN